jgi:hypothetical protein
VPEEIRRIIVPYSRGEYGGTSLARRFGVTVGARSHIVRGDVYVD